MRTKSKPRADQSSARTSFAARAFLKAVAPLEEKLSSQVPGKMVRAKVAALLRLVGPRLCSQSEVPSMSLSCAPL